MSDALSKTIPIWCTVMNRLLFPEHLESADLQRTPDSVSESERDSITERLNDLLMTAKVSLLSCSNLKEADGTRVFLSMYRR